MVEWLSDWLEQSVTTCNLTNSAPIEAGAFSHERLNEISQAGDLVEPLAGAGQAFGAVSGY